MNPNEVKQIIETIKTLNININDATTQKIADAVIPIAQMLVIKEYVSMFLTFFGFLALFYAFYRGIKLFADNEEKERLRKYEIEMKELEYENK